MRLKQISTWTRLWENCHTDENLGNYITEEESLGKNILAGQQYVFKTEESMPPTQMYVLKE